MENIPSIQALNLKGVGELPQILHRIAEKTFLELFFARLKDQSHFCAIWLPRNQADPTALLCESGQFQLPPVSRLEGVGFRAILLPGNSGIGLIQGIQNPPHPIISYDNLQNREGSCTTSRNFPLPSIPQSLRDDEELAFPLIIPFSGRLDWIFAVAQQAKKVARQQNCSSLSLPPFPPSRGSGWSGFSEDRERETEIA